jgi:hypothetical protein
VSAGFYEGGIAQTSTAPYGWFSSWGESSAAALFVALRTTRNSLTAKATMHISVACNGFAELPAATAGLATSGVALLALGLDAGVALRSGSGSS